MKEKERSHPKRRNREVSPKKELKEKVKKKKREISPKKSRKKEKKRDLTQKVVEKK